MRKFSTPAGLPSASRAIVAEEPEAGVGDADEVAARRQEAERRQRAEIARRRGQFQPADEFERPELRLVAADLEIRDRPRGNLHALDADGGGPHRMPGDTENRPADAAAASNPMQKRPARKKAHPARRMPPRRVSRAFSSPNSEASCSVMAPASSSASTMVTARR